MNIEVFGDCDADKLVEDAEFGRKWEALYRRCSWASVFQSRDFILSWYDAYKGLYTLVVLTGHHPDGELAGLFILAVNRESGRLSVAGDQLAEYQAWLAAPNDGNEFIEAALSRLGAIFPTRSLCLLFMLPEVPVDWAVTGSRWKNRCHVRTLPRGLMEIGDGASIHEKLRKKKRSKLNRLKRLGEMRLDRIDRPEKLEAVFDEITCYQALRLRAVYHLPAAPRNPLMRTFYLNLARRGGILHATALRVDDQLASAQIHVHNRGQVLLGLIAHSPFYARYSPGELHLLLTGLELAREKIPTFDLTPGGQYKERFATHYDDVRVVVVFFRRADYWRNKIVRWLVEVVKSAMLGLRVQPERVRAAASRMLELKSRWGRMKPTDLIKAAVGEIKRVCWHTEELAIYSCELVSRREPAASPGMARDRLSDLWAYSPSDASQPPISQFMKQALENLEAGHHVYTRLREGRAVQYGWLMRPQNDKALTVRGHEILLPPDSVLLTEFYTEAGEFFTPDFLSRMLFEASDIFGAKRAFICVSAKNHAQREVIENTGFRYDYSLFRKRVLGSSTTWSTHSAAEQA